MAVSAAGAVAISAAVTKQNFSIAAIKQQQRADEGVLRLVTEAIQTSSQALNSSGRGQVVNIKT